MQRLKLNDFKLKNLNAVDEKRAEKLLGQVLGDCHDEPQCDFCYGDALGCDERSGGGGKPSAIL
ncbi:MULTISPECIES: hypothetical protein [unclassified Aureispira]|uniref:hypothetical protein n=1 Tax=unclassified Aureispira TaxID=2649989 RepID=UPI000698C16F|nr:MULTISPECIES: hypothetical protein [unclassified Aureispira]WMX14217.1 hypothetical protein QP953_25500 [Aureispira sp. CCB-E]